jgi:MFS family permease
MRTGVARGALTVLFAVDGTVFASWASRLPQVQTTVGAGPGGLGLALIGTAIGACAGMPLAGWWCRRRPPAPVALLAALVMCGAVVLPGLARAPVTLLDMLVVFGVAYGAVDVSMNSAAVQLAERLDRPILPGFHAAFSAGNVLGAGVGAVMADRGVAVAAHLAGVGVCCALALLGCVPGLWRSDVTAGESEAASVFGGRLRWVLVAASLTFATASGEGTVANWSGIHLQDATSASAGAAPLGYAAFAVAQVLGRVAGTRVTERHGARRTSMVSAVLAVAGMLVALVPNFEVAVAGYLIAGLGTSCLFPLAIARAGELAGSAGVAVASVCGYGGFLLGPPLIGALAAGSSLTPALVLPVLLAGVCVAGSATLPGRARVPVTR